MFEEQLAMAEMGIKEMQVSVAYAYEFGLYGAQQDTLKAILWYERAGDPESVMRAEALRNPSAA